MKTPVLSNRPQQVSSISFPTHFHTSIDIAKCMGELKDGVWIG
jgi:hypothetical protein